MNDKNILRGVYPSGRSRNRVAETLNTYASLRSKVYNLIDFERFKKQATRRQFIPDGELIGWKKCCREVRLERKYYLVKLKIPSDAYVRCGEYNFCKNKAKHRTNIAKVIDIIPLDNISDSYHSFKEMKSDGTTEVYSIYNEDFSYKIDEIVSVDDFDYSDKQCTSGIHFFLDRQSAIDY